MPVKYRMRKRQPESLLQSSFFKYLSLFHKSYRPYCFAIPNGGSRHPLEAANLKRQGVTAGVPDIFCAIPCGPHHGLFIEFKAGKNKLTEVQKEMIDRLITEGYRCEVCYSLEESINIFSEYTKRG